MRVETNIATDDDDGGVMSLKAKSCHVVCFGPDSAMMIKTASSFTSTFQAGGHIHARRLEADAVLQLPPAVRLVEAETSVYPEVTPVELPAFQNRRCGGEACRLMKNKG